MLANRPVLRSISVCPMRRFFADYNERAHINAPHKCTSYWTSPGVGDHLLGSDDHFAVALLSCRRLRLGDVRFRGSWCQIGTFAWLLVIRPLGVPTPLLSSTILDSMLYSARLYQSGGSSQRESRAMIRLRETKKPLKPMRARGCLRSQRRLSGRIPRRLRSSDLRCHSTSLRQT